MHCLHEGPDTGRIAITTRDLRLLPHGGLDYRHYIARGRKARAEAAAGLFAGLKTRIGDLVARLRTGQQDIVAGPHH